MKIFHNKIMIKARETEVSRIERENIKHQTATDTGDYSKEPTTKSSL
jgi:hypothetical protein